MFEHQSAFMDALRAGRQMRKRIFDTLEQHYAHDFGNSTVGPRLYKNVLSAVRESGAAEAVKEFESRFLPLVNSDPSRDKPDRRITKKLTNQDQPTAVPDRRHGRWIGISALFVVVFLGTLIVGVKALKINQAEAGRSSAKTTASQIIPATAQEVASEGSVAVTKTIEPTSEMTTETVPALSDEQELSGGK